jgi:pimeloyl-ACP methyl ester carboxylesterase
MNPVLLLPGLMNDGRVWQPVLDAFGKNRECVVVPTHSAVGVEAIAASTIAKMPSGPFAVAGFSLGGFVAFEVCRRAIDRVSGVALLSTNARAETSEGRARRQQMIDSVRGAAGSFRAAAESFLPLLMHPSRTGDSAVIALLGDMARDVGSDGFVQQQQTAMDRPDSLETLKMLHVPAMVICGENDQIAPASFSREISSHIQGAELVVIPECGHMVTLEKPEAVIESMSRWLRRVDIEERRRRVG